MSRRKQRSAFDQVSEFDRGRIVAYRDCGLSFREIGSFVGRNQTTVMRICDRWMQEGTTDRRGRSHLPQCTTSLSARTIRRHLQQSGLSARRPLLGLPLHRTTDVSTAQGAMKRCGGQNGMKLSLLTSYASVCNTTMVGFESGNTVEEDAEQLRYAPPHWSCTEYYGVGASCPSLASGLGHSHVSTGIMCDHTRPAFFQRFFVNHQIELLPWLTRSPDLSPIENMWYMVAQRLTQIAPQLPHQINIGKVWKLLGLLYPKNTSKITLNQCRGVWQR
ncbi:transposable element Tcb1 transposase [Trichonephila clavipes]|uniref:Transposable element Tcb1 transposase n=1 Tax=Trichonephila clavipes TaxID=2585209 RepID=A0A8X7BKA9_TRICX|nr:transposable element Tcb1 transposase [Trichonephila clavipes]